MGRSRSIRDSNSKNRPAHIGTPHNSDANIQSSQGEQRQSEEIKREDDNQAEKTETSGSERGDGDISLLLCRFPFIVVLCALRIESLEIKPAL
jgi:hypothetical protein